MLHNLVAMIPPIIYLERWQGSTKKTERIAVLITIDLLSCFSLHGNGRILPKLTILDADALHEKLHERIREY